MTKRKDYRELTIGSFGGYGRKSAPQLRLQGQWLEELGFQIGAPVLVKCEDGRIIITPDEARAELEAREKEFIDKEMAVLNKRFAEEKKKIYRQAVAEREERYGSGEVD